MLRERIVGRTVRKRAVDRHSKTANKICDAGLPARHRGPPRWTTLSVGAVFRRSTPALTSTGDGGRGHCFGWRPVERRETEERSGAARCSLPCWSDGGVPNDKNRPPLPPPDEPNPSVVGEGAVKATIPEPMSKRAHRTGPRGHPYAFFSPATT